jgi:hypothetical protein
MGCNGKTLSQKEKKKKKKTPKKQKTVPLETLIAMTQVVTYPSYPAISLGTIPF